MGFKKKFKQIYNKTVVGKAIATSVDTLKPFYDVAFKIPGETLKTTIVQVGKGNIYDAGKANYTGISDSARTSLNTPGIAWDSASKRWSGTDEYSGKGKAWTRNTGKVGDSMTKAGPALSAWGATTYNPYAVVIGAALTGAGEVQKWQAGESPKPLAKDFFKSYKDLAKRFAKEKAKEYVKDFVPSIPDLPIDVPSGIKNPFSDFNISFKPKEDASLVPAGVLKKKSNASSVSAGLGLAVACVALFFFIKK